MADTNTTTSVLDNLLKNYFVPTALMRLTAETPIYALAEKAPQPKGSGKITYWNAWRNLAPVSSALTEGTANSLPALSSRRVSATVASYGRGYSITDFADLTSLLDTMRGAMDTLADSAKQSLELVCQMGIFRNSIARNGYHSNAHILSSMMSAVASAFCSNTGTAPAAENLQMQFPVVFGTSCSRLSAVSNTAASVSACPSIYAVRKAVQKLRKKDAKPFNDGLFAAYAHPNVLHMLLKDPTFREWNQYQYSAETFQKGQPSLTMGVRWIFSTLCPRYASAAHSVLPIFIFGKQAFGITELDGSIKTFVASGADKSDPFDQLTKITFKFFGAAASLNPSAGIILMGHELL